SSGRPFRLQRHSSGPSFSRTPRKPSHFGSYCQPWAAGSSSTSSASIGGKGTFRPGTNRNPREDMAGPDGGWNVRRPGGLLPPMLGVWKEIQGDRGSTRLGPLPGVPFRVEGLTLRYQRPLDGFMDELTPDGDGFAGRATFRGREFGRFVLE